MKTFRLVISIALLVFSSLDLRAAQLYWDADGTAAGNDPATGAGLGGSGNWDQISPLWFNGGSDIAWVNANNDDAIFSGTAGTVTLTENISAGNLFFTNVTGNYVITNLTGAEVLTVAGAIDTGGGEHTIGALIGNSTTLNKNGVGPLHLPVNNVSTLTGAVVINEGDISVETNNGAGQNNPITVANGAALVLNVGVNNGLTEYNNVTISGSGITNSGALRNLSGVTTFYGQIILGQNNSMIYVDTDAALVYDGENGALTDNGSGYNLIISGSGTGNFQMGETSFVGTLMVEGPASCYAYLTGVTPVAWNSTYISPGGTFYVENNNSFGANSNPSSLITTNCLVDGGTIVSGGTYSMWANGGITVTANGGTLSNASGTWTTCNLYSQANASLTLTGAGSFHPGGSGGVINLGTNALTKGGSGDCNVTYATATTVTYSNLVLNGGSLSFNYDQSSGQTTGLGSLPITLNPANITFNGGSLHVGHSTTIGATRGIYVASGGGTIEDVVSSGGTVTIDSPISGPGSMDFPQGHASVTSTTIFAANNTYTGTTTIGSGAAVTVGAGGGAGTLGTGNTANSGTLTFNRTGTYTYGGVISGSGPVNNNGSGTVTLTGANTYSGTTTIGAGTLLINNTSGSGTGTSPVAVNSGGTLGGSGTISGTVTVASGGTLALGLSKLTINNNLSLAGNVTVSVNKSLTPSNGMAVVSGTLTRTGTGSVTVTNVGAYALDVGDTFQLFSQAVSGGATMTVSGGGGVVWNNNLAVNGTISVVSVPVPQITQEQISAGNFIFSGTTGPDNGMYYVLSTTNLSLPLSQWTHLSTNSFLGNGQFSVTNLINAGNPQQFYLLQVK